MRTYICTAVTLDTVLRFPYRDIHRDTAFLVCRRSGRCRAVYIVVKCRYRKSISFLSIYLSLDILNKIDNVFSSVLVYLRSRKSLVSSVLPALRNCHFYNLLSACVDRVIVHLNDLVALSSVSSLGSSLHQVDRLFLRNDSGKLEECRLKDSIDTSAKSDLFTDLDTVDGVEFDVVVCNVCFYLSRQMFLKSFHIPRTVQKECTAVNKFLNHVVLVHIRRIVACHKVCLMDQVCGFDR